MVKFLLSKKAVSPVIGTILMVAVTVVMAAIIGGFVYQMGRPQTVPNLATSLMDDSRVGLSNGTDNGRIAKLTIESGDIVEKSEIAVMVVYYGGNNTEYTASLDGTAFLVAGTEYNFQVGGGDAISVAWIDADSSSAISPGDRFDFFEDGNGTDETEVYPNSDFTVKLLHKASKSTIASHTIKPN